MVHIALVTSGGSTTNLDTPDYWSVLIRCLSQCGYKITIFDAVYGRAAPPTKQQDGIDIIWVAPLHFNLAMSRFPRGAAFFPQLLCLLINRISYALLVRRYLTSQHFDIIWTVSPTVLVLLSFLHPSMRRRMIYYSISPYIFATNLSLMARLALFVEKLAISLAQRVIVETSKAKELFIKSTRVPAEKVWVIEHGVDIDFWHLEEAERERLREHYGVVNKTVVLFLARIIPRKGVEYLIKAADILVNKKGCRDVVFFIVGPTSETIEPPEVITPYLKGLMGFVHSKGLSEVVKFFPGWHTYESVRGFFAIADIYVLPSLADITPQSIRQAIAMGKPVIATFVGGITTMVEEGKNGFLIPPASAEALANRLELLITDVGLRQRMGEESRHRASGWSIRNRVFEFEKLFLSITQSMCHHGSAI